jgi:hypothetical protein
MIPSGNKRQFRNQNHPSETIEDVLYGDDAQVEFDESARPEILGKFLE